MRAKNLDALSAEFRQIEIARQQAMRKGIPALFRIFDSASGTSGQSQVMRALLIGIYNGEDHPFDLNRLRGLDEALFMDALDAIRLDRHAEKEVHLYLPISAQQEISRWAFWKKPTV